jgi:hypothetical protein
VDRRWRQDQAIQRWPRLTAHLEPGGPCIAVAERQPDGRWLVNGPAMSREHADIALEAAVTVAAASQHPHSAGQAQAGIPVAEANADSSAAIAEVIQGYAPEEAPRFRCPGGAANIPFGAVW